MNLSDTQKERVASTLQFARDRVSPRAREREAAGQFDRRLWDEAAAFGLAGLPIPEEWGGSGLDAYDTMLVVEALGKGSDDGGFVFSLCAHMFASAVPIWRSGSTRHHKRYLSDIAAGKIICANGTTESSAGSDVYAMKTTARKTDTGYVLDGSKCFITNAPVADLFLVYAVTAPTKGYFGISAFLIPRDTPGFTISPSITRRGFGRRLGVLFTLTDAKFLHPLSSGVKAREQRSLRSRWFGSVLVFSLITSAPWKERSSAVSSTSAIASSLAIVLGLSSPSQAVLSI